jgi:hypothetical protein
MPPLKQFVPRNFQPAFPVEQFLVNEHPGEDAVPLDVLIVGGGPAGLASAIRLARQAKNASLELEIGVLEKAQTIGGHCLSGAVINPIALRALFPELEDEDFPLRGMVERERLYWLSKSRKLRLPTPPTMNNHGNYVCSICELVRWLGEKAQALGVHLMTGYPAAALLMDGKRVIGARTAPSGLARDGTPGSSYAPPTDVSAKITILAEGTPAGLLGAHQFHRTQHMLAQVSVAPQHRHRTRFRLPGFDLVGDRPQRGGVVLLEVLVVALELGGVRDIGSADHVVAHGRASLFKAARVASCRAVVTSSVRPRESGDPGAAMDRPVVWPWIPACARTNGG